MQRFMQMIFAMATLVLAGCQATLTLPPYVAVTSRELIGGVEVSDFSYTPSAGIAQNEIRENAAGRVFISDSVASYITNAVRRELRQAGVTLRPGSGCTLSGVINDFAIESLGFNATFKTDIRYTLRSISGDILFDESIRVSFTTDKFTAPTIILASIQKSISDNISQFISNAAVENGLSACRSAEPHARPRA